MTVFEEHSVGVLTSKWLTLLNLSKYLTQNIESKEDFWSKLFQFCELICLGNFGTSY